MGLIEFLTELLGADHQLVATLTARGDGDQPWSDIDDEALDAALDDLRSLADNDDVDADLLGAAVDVATEIRAEIDERAETAAAAAEARAEAAEALRGLTDDEPDSDDSGSDGDPAEPTDDADETSDDTDDSSDDGDTDSGDTPADTEPVLEPVAAAAPARPRRRLHQPRPIDDTGGAPLVAAAASEGFRNGHRFGTEAELGRAMIAAARVADDRRVPVVKGVKTYPADRQVGDDAESNMSKFRAAADAAQNRARDLIDRAQWSGSPHSPEMRALVADGGVCAPAAPRYDFFETSTSARPIRDALPSFDANRGRVIFTPPTLLDTVNPGVTTITENADATGNTDKACVSVACPSNTTVELQAIAQCLQVGNFNNQFYPEQVAHLMRQLNSEHARTAENALWASIVTDSTAVADAEELSATPDIVEAINRYVAYFRDFHRLDDATVLRVLAPRGLRNLIRGDMARRMPGDMTMAVTDAWIVNLFATSGALVTWTNEANGTFEFTSGQGVGAVQGWPATIDLEIFPEGAHLFLDGGMLDLGVVRDSTLNASNNVQFFSEVFEETAHIGPESWDVTLTLCPSGMTAGSHNNDGAFDPCPPGS